MVATLWSGDARVCDLGHFFESKITQKVRNDESRLATAVYAATGHSRG